MVIDIIMLTSPHRTIRLWLSVRRLGGSRPHSSRLCSSSSSSSLSPLRWRGHSLTGLWSQNTTFPARQLQEPPDRNTKCNCALCKVRSRSTARKVPSPSRKAFGDVLRRKCSIYRAVSEVVKENTPPVDVEGTVSSILWVCFRSC